MSRLKDLILEIQEDIEFAKDSGIKVTRDGIIGLVKEVKPMISKSFIGDVYDLMHDEGN